MARYGQNGNEAGRRRARLAELLRDGLRTSDAVSVCMAEFGVAQPTVYKDLRTLRAEAAERCAVDAEVVVKRQLADLTTAREVALEQIQEAPRQAYRFIPGLASLLDREARLLGLDRPEKREISGPNGFPLVIEVTPVDYVDAIAPLAPGPMGDCSGPSDGQGSGNG